MARKPYEDWLDGGVPLELFKDDRRSRVWLVRTPELGRVVIKRFEFSPWRQRLAWLVRLHPAQRERRINRYLASRGVPVLPVIQAGTRRQWSGDRLWLARPLWGRSLQHWLLRPSPPTWKVRRRIIHATAQILAGLMDLRLAFPHLTTLNLIASSDGQVWLNDVAQLHRARGSRRKLRMLATLDRSAAGDRATRTDRLRCLKMVLTLHRDLGPWRAVAQAVLAREKRL